MKLFKDQAGLTVSTAFSVTLLEKRTVVVSDSSSKNIRISSNQAHSKVED